MLSAHLIKFNNMGMIQHLHHLYFAKYFFQVILIQLTLVDNFDGNLVGKEADEKIKSHQNEVRKYKTEWIIALVKGLTLDMMSIRSKNPLHSVKFSENRRKWFESALTANITSSKVARSDESSTFVLVMQCVASLTTAKFPFPIVFSIL